MAISERDRARLTASLRRTLGEEESAILMAHLPRDVDELATKEFVRSELASFRGEVRAEFAEFRGEVRAEFAEFRGEVRAEFAEFRGEMREGFAAVRAEFRGEILAAVTTQTRMVFFALVATIAAITGLAVTLARLQP